MRARRPSESAAPKVLASRSAFSLVEVAMALGIASFAIISLLGLMTVSLDASKRAYEDTTVSSIAQTVLSEVRTNGFDRLANGNPFPDRYFSYDGTPLPSPESAYYKCNVRSLAHTSPDLPAAALKTSAGVRISLAFFWPPTNTKTNEVFETTIARF